MSHNGQQDASVWRCICGRQVPTRMEECHCGLTRDQALAYAKKDDPPPRKPLTLLGLSLRLGAAAFVIVMAVAVYLVYFPPAPPPLPASPSLTPLAPSSPSPVASVAPAETLPPGSDDSRNWDLQAPPVAIEPRPTPAEPTEADILRAKTEQWRGRYKVAAERVAQLQREVVLLEAGLLPYDASHPERNADIRRLNELLKERLDAARKDLEQARQQLSGIEESAASDGIVPGQLR